MLEALRTASKLYDFDEHARLLGATVLRDRKTPALYKHGVRLEFKARVSDMHLTVRWRAELPLPGVPRFRIYPEGFRSFMSKALGGQDVEVGIAAFDMRFMVKARDPALVKQLWTSRLCAKLVALAPPVTIEGDEQELRLEQRFGGEDDAEVIPGLELLCDLAAVDLYGRELLRGQPDARLHPDHGEVWLPGPGSLRLGYVRSGERVAMVARATSNSDVSNETKARFQRLGVSIDNSGDELIAAWDGIEQDSARIAAVVDALRAQVTMFESGYR